ncbi:MAG: hypothetical protein ACYDCO_00820 [Armatimonadota bacterium]
MHLIRLTEKGQLAYQEHHQYHQALTAQMLAVLTEEEATLMLAMLRKLNTEAL